MRAERAAHVAAAAAVGGIVISPEAHAPGATILARSKGPASEFQDSEITLSGLAEHAVDAMAATVPAALR